MTNSTSPIVAVATGTVSLPQTSGTDALLPLDVLQVDHYLPDQGSECYARPINRAQRRARGYQRQEKQKKVRKMADNLQPSLLSRGIVNQRADGSYWVIDGQQRLAALRLFVANGGVSDGFPCTLFVGLTREQEAEIFRAIHMGRTPLHGGEVFASRLSSGEEKALRLEQIITDAGLSLKLDGGKKPRRTITAIRTIEDVSRLYGESILVTTLDVLSSTWGESQIEEVWRSAYVQNILLGVGKFLHEACAASDLPPTTVRNRLKGILNRITPGILTQAAAQYMYGVTTGTEGGAHAKALVGFYNRGLHTDNRKVRRWW